MQERVSAPRERVSWGRAANRAGPTVIVSPNEVHALVPLSSLTNYPGKLSGLSDPKAKQGCTVHSDTSIIVKAQQRDDGTKCGSSRGLGCAEDRHKLAVEA